MSQLASFCAYICIYSIIHVAFPAFPESCGFESDCSEWTSEQYWTRMRFGQFDNNSNAPKTDHTLRKSVGFYLYLMSNSPPDEINVAKLLSKTLKQPHTCLIFWYSMYESDVQSLKVFRTTGDSTMVEMWNKTGNLPNVWNEAQVEFSYNGEFQLMFEGTKSSAGHMALDDISVSKVCPATSTTTQSTSDSITSIGNADSKKNQLSYGVYVGIATGLVAILLIAGIVTLIIIRKIRRRQSSQKKQTISGRDLQNAKKHGDIHEEEKANISNHNPDGKCTESNENHLNVQTTNNYPCGEMPDAQFDLVANTCDENTNIQPYKQANIYDYRGADDVYNTTYEPSRQMDDNTYDHISRKDDYESTTKVLKKEVFDPTYSHTTEKETHDETQATEKYAMASQTYELVRMNSVTR